MQCGLLLTVLSFSELQSHTTYGGLFVRVPVMNKCFQNAFSDMFIFTHRELLSICLATYPTGTMNFGGRKEMLELADVSLGFIDPESGGCNVPIAPTNGASTDILAPDAMTRITPIMNISSMKTVRSRPGNGWTSVTPATPIF